MGKILHLSDFHLGRNEAIEKEKLEKLSIFLKNRDIEYLVYTGDIIDANIIAMECYLKMVKKYPEKYSWYLENESKTEKEFSEKNKKIDELKRKIIEEGDEKCFNTFLETDTLHAMKKAHNQIDNFIKKIGSIAPEKVIFCCGNHDRLRKLKAEKNVNICPKKNENKDIMEDIMEDDFIPYNTFCSDMGFKFDYHTQEYKAGDLTFIIANSNWHTPEHGETNNACLNCKVLNNCVKKIRDDTEYDRNHTILICHKPIDDICEMAKFPYDGREYTLKEILEMSVAAFLYGDKHSSDTETKTAMKKFMCGAPLSTPYIDYSLLEINHGQEIMARYISWNEEGNEWRFRPLHECIGEIYNVSKCYLKKKLLRYLHVNNIVPVDWKSAIDVLTNEEGRLLALSDLFKSCSRIGDGSRKRLKSDDNLFEVFTSLLLEKEGHKPINIKGNKGTGKSSFLTIEYLYLLEKFKNGKIQYMPFYFNFEGIMDSSNTRTEEDIQYDANKIMDIQYKEFEKYLNECIRLNEKYKIPICILIDGLEQKNLILYRVDMTLEKRISEKLDSVQAIGKYVMCFNSCDYPAFGFSYQDVNTFDYILYMNDVDVVPYKKGWESYTHLTTAYMKISKGKKGLSPDEYLQNLFKLHKTSINMKFLAENDDFIRSIRTDISSDEVHYKYVKELEKRTNRLFCLDRCSPDKRNLLGKVAYLVGLQGKCFQEILEKNPECITYKEFVNIRDRTDISEYLIAMHYIKELSLYASDEKSIAEDSILKCFISRNIAVFIRSILKSETGSNNRMLVQFIEKHSSEFEGYLYSMMIYLSGYLEDEISFSYIWDRKKDGYKLKKKKFENYCALRSFDIANIVRNNSPEDKLKFLDKLLSNEEYRRFNREFQLYYYEDIKINHKYRLGEKCRNTHYRKGFDFHNCFLVLFSKLRYNLNIEKTYPLMEVDLFTLCDLVYSRLQLPMNLNLERKETFFYGADYNEKEDSLSNSVLDIIIKLLKDYIEGKRVYNWGYHENTPFIVYFRYMKKLFENIQKKHAQKQDSTVQVSYASHAECYKHILELENFKRVGWEITKAGNVQKKELDDVNKLKSKGKETIMQSIIESVYIAQMFLPECLPKESGYDKSKVISLLLMSELGKYETKDYVPQTEYSRFLELQQKETEKRDDFLILGCLDGYANNLSLMEFFNDDSNINLQICHEIQKIQMEYKYYRLYSQLNFSIAREKELQHDFDTPYTIAVCKDIREKLILNNPDFYMFFHRSIEPKD